MHTRLVEGEIQYLYYYKASVRQPYHNFIVLYIYIYMDILSVAPFLSLSLYF